MLSKDLQEILDIAGGRYIIVEDGNPKYIVMGFEEYKRALLDKKDIKALTEEELVAKINADISIWRENNQKTDEGLRSEVEKLENIEYI